MPKSRTPAPTHRVRGQCGFAQTSLDPFTVEEKMGAARPGNRIKVTIRVQNAEIFDLTGLTLTMPTPPGTTYIKSKMTARPDGFNAKGDGKTPKATLAGNTLTWNDFILPANQSRPRVAYVWYRVNKGTATGTIPIGPATVSNATQSSCAFNSTTDSVRAVGTLMVFGVCMCGEGEKGDKY